MQNPSPNSGEGFLYKKPALQIANGSLLALSSRKYLTYSNECFANNPYFSIEDHLGYKEQYQN